MHPPLARPAFRTLPLGAVRPRGWLLAQLRRDLADGFAARLDRLTPHAAHDLFRDRIPSSSEPRAWWDAETRGNWLWGYVMMAHLADAPEHQARVAELMRGLLATQDADGYIGIYAPDQRYRHADGENGELWAQSRALLSLIAWHDATGEPRALEAVRRAADLTLRHCTAERPCFRRGERVARDALTGLTHGLCYLDALERLHDDTGAAAYAEAGVRLYEEFSRMPRPFPNDDLALPSLADPKRDYAGHAVHTAEHLRALLWAHAAAPERVSAAAVETALLRLDRHRLPSGALPGDEAIHGLPLPESAYEFCTTAELALSLASAVQKLGRAGAGDRLETLAFNAAQGARLPDGRAIAYLSADTRLFATAARPDSYSAGAPSGRYKYSPTHDDVACCCNPNAVRFLPQLVSRMWMRLASDQGFAAIAYGPCELRASVGDVPVTITEDTGYPFSDAIELTVTPARPVEFTLVLRRPGWPGTMDVALAGAEAVATDGWWRIRKTWAAGERVRVGFGWAVRSEPYANGEVAVLRGPLQYAMPLDHRLEVVRRYDIEGMCDYDVVPEDIAQGYRIPVLDSKAPDLGLTLEARAAGDGDHPWDVPRFLLHGGATTLVPLGCTVLRRAAFPLR
ncbi:MAG TPA: beta-L-arabinofuranosidase domain-containing protein [Gemmatimonadales bacterium]|nr:beta-L-arabinofuranosidase domain-containing protein [Gemmatimonadales bacterium]